ncbi:MAG: 4-hydroxy-tetrahydrodipicolinate synthase [Flavisolibacter sp.]
MSLRDQLKGTGVALITPFTSNYSVDFKTLAKLVNFVIDGGVQYIIVLGTTGETPTLSQQEKIDIIDAAFSSATGRVPLVIGIGGNSTQAVIKEIETLPLDKGVAVLSASPYYNKPSQEGIFQHYKAIATASSKPIILYNVPTRTGSNISAETTIRLAEEIVNINGIKEASGNMAQCMQILRDKPQDFLVVSGDDALALPQIACGMEGVISVAANCFPKDFSLMVKAALNGDFFTARKLNNVLIKGYDLLFSENNPAGVKAFLSELGLIQNYLRLPLVSLGEGLMKDVRQYLTTLN